MKKVVFSVFTILLAHQGVICMDSPHDGFYWGIGPGYSSFEAEASDKDDKYKEAKTFSDIIGSIAIGSGKIPNGYQSLYFGGELSLDVSKSERHTGKLNGTDISLKKSGLDPRFAFKIGCVTGSMLWFVKAGLCYMKTSMDYKETSLNNSSCRPCFGIGLQFTHPNGHGVIVEASIVTSKTATNNEYKLRCEKGWVVRCMYIKSIPF